MNPKRQKQHGNHKWMQNDHRETKITKNKHCPILWGTFHQQILTNSINLYVHECEIQVMSVHKTATTVVDTDMSSLKIICNFEFDIVCLLVTSWTVPLNCAHTETGSSFTSFCASVHSTVHSLKWLWICVCGAYSYAFVLLSKNISNQLWKSLLWYIAVPAHVTIHSHLMMVLALQLRLQWHNIPAQIRSRQARWWGLQPILQSAGFILGSDWIKLD